MKTARIRPQKTPYWQASPRSVVQRHDYKAPRLITPLHRARRPCWLRLSNTLVPTGLLALFNLFSGSTTAKRQSLVVRCLKLGCWTRHLARRCFHYAHPRIRATPRISLMALHSVFKSKALCETCILTVTSLMRFLRLRFRSDQQPTHRYAVENFETMTGILSILSDTGSRSALEPSLFPECVTGGSQSQMAVTSRHSVSRVDLAIVCCRRLCCMLHARSGPHAANGSTTHDLADSRVHLDASTTRLCIRLSGKLFQRQSAGSRITVKGSPTFMRRAYYSRAPQPC